MRVVVTLGKHPKTLAVVRSLGLSGRRVFLTDDVRFPMSSFSRYCTESYLLPHPGKRPKEFLDELVILAEKVAADLIIPMDEAECDILSVDANTKRLRAPVAVAKERSYQVARNKHRTMCLASQLGIASPKTLLIEGADAVESIPSAIGFPAIVKPVKGSGSRGFSILRALGDLEDIPESLSKYGDLIAQEFIPSAGAIGVSVLMNHGECRAIFTHQRIVQFPEDGGPSIVRTSIRHFEAEQIACTLLESLKWHGVGMVEFRIDSRTGKPILMEVNPRFWGSLPLAIACGVDFPKLLCDMYEDGDISCVKTYKIGVHCVNLLPFGLSSSLLSGDIRKVVGLIRDGWTYRCFDVESTRDPLPTFGALLSMLRFAFDPEMIDAVLRR